MKIFYTFDSFPVSCETIVTVGSFDGLHLGHRALIGRLVESARKNGIESVVVTFDPHPRTVTGNGVKELTSPEEKARLLEMAGVDNLVVVPFTEEFRHTPWADFLRDCLVGKLGAVMLLVGYNHHFGRNREGGFDTLDSLRDELGVAVERVEKQDVGDDHVSSTVIRNLISEGRMAEANRLLGYRYMVIAEKISAGVFAPAYGNKLLPPPGDYAATVDGRPNRLTITSDGRLIPERPEKIETEKIILEFDV